MFDHECKTLAECLAAKLVDGLVDIKFFVNPFAGATPTEVYAEAEALIIAVDNPELVKEFSFNDDARLAA